MITPQLPPERTYRRITASARHWQPAFTLMEVLIVLVLLLSILSVAWPSMSRLYQRQQLRQSAMLVQSQVSAARLNAIERSLSYSFWYEPNGRRYRVAPSTGTTTFAVPSYGSTDATSERPSFSGTLPSAVRFAARNNPLQAGASSRRPADRGARRTANGSFGSWSKPVVFYPDGTSRDAEIVLSDAENRTMRIVVRGLIGSVRLESGASP
jgi:prepilin-type N-terminal cleavage/methylation domain-containing protein